MVYLKFFATSRLAFAAQLAECERSCRRLRVTSFVAWQPSHGASAGAWGVTHDLEKETRRCDVSASWKLCFAYQHIRQAAPYISFVPSFWQIKHGWVYHAQIYGAQIL